MTLRVWTLLLLLAAPAGAREFLSEEPALGGPLGETLRTLREDASKLPTPSGVEILIASNPSEQASPGHCEHSWEERPGTTDYTVWDSYARRRATRADRPQSRTLQGSPAYAGLNLCARAKVLKRCFDRAIYTSGAPAAGAFRAWASSRRINPSRALMAIAAQETRLGTKADSCRGQTCNGIGLMQIITAIAPDGRVISNSDPRWAGITHNILTNIAYALRVVNEKLPGAGTLHDLASRYNGSGTREDYARKVNKYYVDIGKCDF